MNKVSWDDALASGDMIKEQAVLIEKLEAQRDDLLEALQYAVEVSAEGLPLGPDWQERARAAIEKARGVEWIKFVSALLCRVVN